MNFGPARSTACERPLRPFFAVRNVCVIATVFFALAGTSPAQRPGARESALDNVVLLPTDTAAHIFSSPTSGTIDSLRLVIRDSTALAEFWKRLDRSDWPRPRVDFATHDVLVASLGPRGYEGPYIAIDSVGIRAGRRIVIVRKALFRGNYCLVGGDPSAPHATDVVVVPRDSVHATQFVDRIASLHCGGPGDPRPLRRPPHQQ